MSCLSYMNVAEGASLSSFAARELDYLYDTYDEESARRLRVADVDGWRERFSVKTNMN